MANMLNGLLKKDDESLEEKVENSYSYKDYVIINDSKANCWRIKDSKDNWVGNCFSTDKEAEEFIDDKNESLKEEYRSATSQDFSDIIGVIVSDITEDNIDIQEAIDENIEDWIVIESLVRPDEVIEALKNNGIDIHKKVEKIVRGKLPKDKNESLKEEKDGNKEWYWYTFEKGSKANAFKRFLKSKDVYYEANEDGENIQFDVLIDDYDLLPEIDTFSEKLYKNESLKEDYSDTIDEGYVIDQSAKNEVKNPETDS